MLFWIFTKMCEYFLILIWSSHLWDGNKTTHNFFFQCPSPPIYFRCGIRHNTSEASNLSVDHIRLLNQSGLCVMHPFGREEETSRRELFGFFTRCLTRGEWELAAACVGQLGDASEDDPHGPHDIVKAIVTHPYQLRWVFLTGINCRKAQRHEPMPRTIM